MMKTTKHSMFSSMPMLAAACGLIAILALATASVAQQAAPAQAKPAVAPAHATAAPVASPSSEEESPVPNSGNHQGIKVHGHWILQVKNADGTLGERREFDNSLVHEATLPGGDTLLAGLISGNMSVGVPAIGFLTTTTIPSSGGFDISNDCYGTQCFIYYPQGSSFFTHMQVYTETGLVSTLSIAPGGVQWVLSGNYVVPAELTQIAMVQTLYEACMLTSLAQYNSQNQLLVNTTGLSSDFSSIACSASNYGTINANYTAMAGTLTSTAVTPGPLAVTPGQIIAIKVIITFS